MTIEISIDENQRGNWCIDVAYSNAVRSVWSDAVTVEQLTTDKHNWRLTGYCNQLYKNTIKIEYTVVITPDWSTPGGNQIGRSYFCILYKLYILNKTRAYKNI